MNLKADLIHSLFHYLVSVPLSLLPFVTALLYGPMYTGTLSQEVLTISQLIIFDTKKTKTKSFYKTRTNSTSPLLPGISTILPLFMEKAATPAMIKHAFNVLIAIVSLCNPGQYPIMATDLPIYAIGKQLQWMYPAMVSTSLLYC